ncbi:apotyrosinase chaperone MelC1 [Streptomyces murinus]|uniref:apotyrosinase chaperone MelC1 n=1 Tax=Streptomyces murinus TaxID=33900 RepID=UPI0038160926
MSAPTRRRVLLGTIAGLAGVAVATPVAVSATGAKDAEKVPDGGRLASFEETYKGRRIQGKPVDGMHGHHGSKHHTDGYTVFIDSQELHVMRNADTTWISVVNHYRTFATPREVARAAVDELQGASLLALA